MKRQLSVLIGMLLVFTVASSVFIYEWLNSTGNYPEAREGVLDARSWRFSDNGIIPLRGEWEFYKGKLLTPKDFADHAEKLQAERLLLQVPEKWDNRVSVDGHGAGTYRLRLLVSDLGDYSLRIKKIRLSSRIFMEGEEIGGNGKPALSAQDFIPNNVPFLGRIDVEDKTVEIIVQVASFRYVEGGIVQAPEFGLTEDVMNRRDNARMADMIVITTLLTFGIFFAGMFRQWRREPYLIYFSLFCCSLGLFFSIDNEIIAANLFPSMSFLLLQKLLFILPYFTMFFFIHYVRLSLHDQSGRYFKTFIWSSYVYLLLLIVSPNEYLLTLFWFGAVLQIIGFCFIFLIIIRNRQQGVKVYYIMLGAFFLTITWIVAQARYQLAIDSPYYLTITLVLVVLSQSFLMTDQMQGAFLKSERLAQQLLVRDRQKDEFLAKTSHELRTPLHGIVNLSESLLENKETPLASEHRENIRLLHLIGRRLSGLVNDILDMNRIRYGQLNVHLKPVDLYVSTRFVMETLSIAPFKSSVRLVNELPTRLPLILADENRLRQILYNLLENGLKYTDQGTVSISAEQREELLYISVSDTGKGIHREAMENLFEPFFQHDEEGFHSRDGIGLGLSISKQLVELQGGQLQVQSEVGIGSQFTFTLPVFLDNVQEAAITLEKSEAGQQNHPKMGSDRSNKEYGNWSEQHPLLQEGYAPPLMASHMSLNDGEIFHILIVDDEPSNLKVAMDAIDSLGHTYTTAGGGVEALEALRELKPDLVLLDLMMPEISGLDICLEIRTLYDLAELPVLMLTASGQTRDIIAAFSAGANDILQKPFELAELRARVQSLLAMKSSSERAVRREMDFLQAQIPPHFLYNSLNAMVGLSYKDVDKLRATIHHLTTYLRAKFTFVFHGDEVPLERELELVRAYLAIEQLRFGQRLAVRYTIDEDAHILLPPLILQPIVENAVRHGIGQKPEGGTVDIIISKRDWGIEIIVEDDGVGMGEDKLKLLMMGKPSGVGIYNVNRRLQMRYGRSLDIVSQPNKGTKITIYLTEARHA
ncbi:signal transduction histidine kinase [Paenibacillus turicensis]|uniref:histidine kinase n=1 Tax=Paenibacillus turicensis TaxID=160487 RepID=A0ABS4FV91_9BACL|nr:ATP-binding protein [Paenibacillus turicensis]MBP1906498.1 signal transduction histidine kinase [Paenibacillus turicensis]